VLFQNALLSYCTLYTDSPNGSIDAVAGHVNLLKLLVIYFFGSQDRGLRVVQYHHATPLSSIMRRMKMTMGYGLWVTKDDVFHLCNRVQGKATAANAF